MLHTNGTGYVAACDGDYADAIAKYHKTHLLIVETTGAHNAALTWDCCVGLGSAGRNPTPTEGGAIDGTAYGWMARLAPLARTSSHIT